MQREEFARTALGGGVCSWSVGGDTFRPMTKWHTMVGVRGGGKLLVSWLRSEREEEEEAEVPQSFSRARLH